MGGLAGLGGLASLVGLRKAKGPNNKKNFDSHLYDHAPSSGPNKKELKPLKPMVFTETHIAVSVNF